MPVRFDSLDDDEQALVLAETSGTHHRNIDLDVYRRRTGKAVMSLSEQFIGGMIEGDQTRDPVMFMECDILDEDEDLDWDGGEFRQFDVQVIDSRFIRALNDWVYDIVFTGPIWAFERDGGQVRLTAEGPEMRLMGSVRKPFSRPAKAKATRVIRELFAEAGARPRDMVIPSLKVTLPRETVVVPKQKKDKNDGKKGKKDKAAIATVGVDREARLNVDRGDTPWNEGGEIAKGINRDLFGDLDGKVVLANPKFRPKVFLTKQNLIAPAIPKDEGEVDLTNTWIVVGADPKGKKKAPSARIELPEGHENSAKNLGWNDTPRPEIKTIKSKQIRTNEMARVLGRRKMDEARRESTTLEVSTLPVTFGWRPFSLVSVPTESGRSTTLVRKWQVPLGPGADPMTLGSTDRTRLRKRPLHSSISKVGGTKKDKKSKGSSSISSVGKGKK